MIRMFVVVAGVLLVCVSAARADSPVDVVRANELRISRAAIANDGKVFDELLADDFHSINCDGSREDKKKYTDEYRSGNFKIAIYDQSEVKIQSIDSIVMSAICVLP